MHKIVTVFDACGIMIWNQCLVLQIPDNNLSLSHWKSVQFWPIIPSSQNFIPSCLSDVGNQKYWKIVNRVGKIKFSFCSFRVEGISWATDIGHGATETEGWRRCTSNQRTDPQSYIGKYEGSCLQYIWTLPLRKGEQILWQNGESVCKENGCVTE